MSFTQTYFTKIFKLLAIALLALPIVLFVFVPYADAATGILKQINFQGKVVNTNGTNVTNGSYNFLFCLYTTASPTTACTAAANNDAVWRESKSLAVTDGVFQTLLGDTTALPGSVDFNTDNIYLGVNFNSDGQMTPLVRFSAVPYAFNADKIHGLTVTDTTGTFTLTNGKTLSVSNTLTFAGTDSTTITFQGTDTYVGRATTDTLTNKTIGSSGLTFSGATTDITTVSNEDLTLAVNGSGNFVFSTDFDSGITLGTAISNEFPLLVRSGIGNNATLAIDNLNSGDLFTASASGTTKFTLANNGNITATGNLTGLTGLTLSSGAINLGGTNGTSSDCLKGGTTAAWGSCAAGAGSNWDVVGGVITPKLTSTLDFLLGSTATVSAKFAVLNINSGTSIASVAGNMSLGSDSGTTRTIGSTAKNPLQLGDANTGDLIFAPNNSVLMTLKAQGYIGIGSTAPTNKFEVLETKTDTSGFLQMVFNRITANPSSASTATFVGLYNESRINSGNAQDFTNASVVGLYNTAHHRGTATLTNAYGVQGIVKTDNTGTITNAHAFHALGQITVLAGTMSTYAGYYAQNPSNSGAGTLTNNYGLYIENQTTGGSDYGIYIAGADTNAIWVDAGTSRFDGIIDAQSDISDSTGNLTLNDTVDISGGLTITAGQTLTFNSDAFTDLTGSGLAVSANALTINLTASGITGSTSSNSGLEVATAGLTLLKGCTDGQLLEYTDAGGWACANDDTGGGGGGSSNWTLGSGILRPNNNTVDIVFGGTSTGSAKFIFGGLNAGTPTATFSGDLILNNKPTTAVGDMQRWSQITGTAGTIGGGATTAIASVSASAVYNGSLYIGTNKANAAEVYRYDGTGTTWTKVSNATAGTIASGGTANIDRIASMAVYNGYMYVGTEELNAAEIYRYDGGTTWTKVSNATAGTIRTGGTAAIDGVVSMQVFTGKLYIGTKEGAKAELYRYEGGTSWQIQNTTAGTFVTTNTAAVNSISSMVSYGGSLYLGMQKNGDADFVRFTGVPGTGFLAMNAAGTTGSYNTYMAEAGTVTAVTAFDEVVSLAVYNGRIVLGMRKNNAADVFVWNPNEVTTTTDTFYRINSAAGTIATGGTASIDSISAMAVYNGRLYVGTAEANSAEIYRYDGNLGIWTKVSQNSAGTIAAGGTGSIDAISTLINFNHNTLFAGILEGTSAQGYSYSSSIDQSYALKFHAASSQAGGEQNLQQNLASIFFVASLSANINNKAGNTGAFVFSHNIMTNNGSYDVAEDFPTRDDSLEPGDVVSIDTNERGFVKKSERAYDYSTVGVYSEKPALRLSQDSSTINGGHPIPVALAGRVPIKVSSENGEIRSGDFLTTASIPGVAMKAKKAGAIIGVAIETYEGQGIGKVVAYIKSSSYNGSIAQNFVNIDANSETFGNEVLAALETSDKGLTGSEIVTDKLIAGIEIVTPKLTVDSLFARRIKADQIDGLEFITSEIADLRSQVLGVDQKISSVSVAASPSAVLETQIQTLTDQLLERDLESASKSSLTSQNGLSIINDNIRVKGNGLIEGILTVIDSLTTNNFIVNGVSTFFGEVIFKDKAIFEKGLVLGEANAGRAIIKKGDKKVEVKFSQELEEEPIVQVNLYLSELSDEDYNKMVENNTCDQDKGKNSCQEKLENEAIANSQFIISKQSKKGFAISMSKEAVQDTKFSWVIVGTK